MTRTAIILTSLAITTAANAAECPAAMPIRIEPHEVWRGPVFIEEPDAYPISFELLEGAEIHGGRHGLVLMLKLCDGRATLEVGAP